MHENITTSAHGGEGERREWGVAGQGIAEALRELLEARAAGDAGPPTSEGRAQQQWLTRVAHIECVKSYAPRIYHLVFDIECKPLLR